MIECWTDGSGPSAQARKGQESRGLGGWAALLVLPGNPFVIELSGAVEDTTSSRMELQAAIEGLSWRGLTSPIQIHSDSAYLVNAFEQRWIDGWIRRGWRTSKGTPVKNKDLWLALIELTFQRHVRFVKVKGHSGVKHNHVVDRLAARAKQQSTLAA